jgi:CRP/FNR family transcriptional regulator, cyclic AMP receptor protein
MSDDVSIDQFHTVPALKGLTAAELDVVDTITFSVALKPGQTLFKEGDPGDGMYVIVSGSVEVTKQVDEGSRWQIAQHGPGMCFGEMALLGNQVRAATCTALEPTLLLKVPYKDFSALLKQSNIAALKITGNLARSLSMRMSQLLAEQTRILKAHRAFSGEVQKHLLTTYQRAEGVKQPTVTSAAPSAPPRRPA